MGKAPEHIKQNNERLCDPNKRLQFKGIVAVHRTDHRTGKDVLDMDILFSEGISFRRFNVGESIYAKGKLAVALDSLCAALGTRWGSAKAFNWEDLITTLSLYLKPCKGTMIYAKITLNEGDWLELGEGRCFSAEPDMEYTDNDTRFINYDPVATHIDSDILPF